VTGIENYVFPEPIPRHEVPVVGKETENVTFPPLYVTVIELLAGAQVVHPPKIV